MAIGDILSCVIRADGWSADVTIEGFTTDATYDFGSLDNTVPTLTSPTFTITVVSEGYSSSGTLGTVVRTVYGTHAVRKPYPDQATTDETASGGNMTVRVALSDCVYDDDKNGGAGTSGTDPVVTIAAGWGTNTGGSSETSAAATALACTNNSTLDYPKCIAQWAWGHTPAFRRVENSFSIGCIAFHGIGISCVALSATDQHSHAVSGTATTRTAHQMSASQLYYESYDLAVPVSGMTEGDDITLRFIAYPLVGDADSIIDTSTNTTATDHIRGLTQITCTYKTTGISTKYVATTGADTNDGSESTPYLTIGKALAVGADIIYVRAGTHDILGTAPASVTARNYAVEVRPYTGESVTLNRGGSVQAYRASRLLYSGFSITYSSGNGWLDGEAGDRMLFFENCSIDGAAAPMVGLGYRSYGCWFVNCTIGRDYFSDFSSSRIAHTFTGCKRTMADARVGAVYAIVACDLTGGIRDKAAANIAPQQDNTICVNSRFMGVTTSSADIVYLSIIGNRAGLAFVGNLIEVATVSSSQTALSIGADGAVTDIVDFIVAHNTVIGERCNLFYNDSGAAANVRKNVFCRCNAFQSYNIKSDVYALSGANIGNWAMINGVGYADNRYDGTVSSTFTGDYPGINTAYVTGKDATFGQLGYTDDNSAIGDGTGNGDYMPAAGSPLIGHTLIMKYQAVDLYGASIDDCIGALQIPLASPTTPAAMMMGL